MRWPTLLASAVAAFPAWPSGEFGTSILPVIGTVAAVALSMRLSRGRPTRSARAAGPGPWGAHRTHGRW